MATSLQSLRQSLGLLSGLGFNVETTSGGSATTAVSTNLIDYFDSDDEPINRWCWPIDTSSAVARRISDFTQSTGTVTVGTGFGAIPGTTSTIEIWKIRPALVDEAIKRTIEAIYPRLHIPYGDETLISGNWLRDGSFEEWSSSSALLFHAKTASLTLARESTTVLYGAYSAKLTTTSTTQYLYQSDVEVPQLLDLAGNTVDFRSWVYTDTASHARLQIYTKDLDGNEVTTSTDSYHPGDSRWHLMEITDKGLPSGLRSIQFRFACDVNSTDAYFDHARVIGGVQRSIFLPRAGWKELRSVSLQTTQSRTESDEDLDPCDDLGAGRTFVRINGIRIDEDGTEKILRLPVTLPSGYTIRLIGGSLLTVPSSDTATTELDSPETEYLIVESLVRLYRMRPEGATTEDIERFREEQIYWEREADKLKRKHQMLLPPNSMGG